MSTLAARPSKAKARSARADAKSAVKRPTARGPSFGKWARRVSGMMKDGPPDLSMREGFGN